jgi:hypothetical protein
MAHQNSFGLVSAFVAIQDCLMPLEFVGAVCVEGPWLVHEVMSVDRSLARQSVVLGKLEPLLIGLVLLPVANFVGLA